MNGGEISEVFVACRSQIKPLTRQRTQKAEKRKMPLNSITFSPFEKKRIFSLFPPPLCVFLRHSLSPFHLGRREKRQPARRRCRVKGEQAEEFSETNTPYHSCAVENFSEAFVWRGGSGNCFKAESHSRHDPFRDVG